MSRTSTFATGDVTIDVHGHQSRAHRYQLKYGTTTLTSANAIVNVGYIDVEVPGIRSSSCETKR
jgi:hypothetical protein